MVLTHDILETGMWGPVFNAMVKVGGRASDEAQVVIRSAGNEFVAKLGVCRKSMQVEMAQTKILRWQGGMQFIFR